MRSGYSGMLDEGVKHRDSAEGIRQRTLIIELDLAVWRQLKEQWGIETATLKSRKRESGTGAGDGSPERKKRRE